MPDNMLVLRHFFCFKSQLGNSFFEREEGEFLLCNMYFPKSLLLLFIACSCQRFETLPHSEEDTK